MTGNKAQGQQIEDTMSTAGKLIDSIISSNAILSPFLSFALAQLYGSIRSLQMQASSLIKIPIPAHAQIYYEVLATVSALDPLGAEDFYAENLNLTETKPFNANFEKFGMETSTFILCTGPFFYILAFVILYHFLKYLVQMCARKFNKYTFCRKIGVSTSV